MNAKAIKADYRNIKRLFGVVSRALFRADSVLSYTRTLEAIERLVDEVRKTDTDESVWYIGENECATLDALIVGTYWFLGDYHSGQGSIEYRVLSAIGGIYKPGMTCGPERDSSEEDVYDALEVKHCPEPEIENSGDCAND